MKFTQEFKDNWLWALRSGDYKQSKSQLRADGGYCCLGLLCEVNNIPYNNVSPMVEEYANYGLFDAFFTVEEVINLYRMNDLQDKSFSEIADYIEKNIPVQE